MTWFLRRGDYTLAGDEAVILETAGVSLLGAGVIVRGTLTLTNKRLPFRAQRFAERIDLSLGIEEITLCAIDGSGVRGRTARLRMQQVVVLETSDWQCRLQVYLADDLVRRINEQRVAKL